MTPANSIRSLYRGAAAFGLLLACAPSLQASTFTFSPQPARAGQAITFIFTSFAFGICGDGLAEGQMEVVSIDAGVVVLTATPPPCPFLVSGWEPYFARSTFGPLAPGTYRVEVYERGAGETLEESRLIEVLAAPVCTATATQLCLGDSRFEVTATWRDFAGNSGLARTVPDQLEGRGHHGRLWFFTEDNPEVLVKVVDGCALNGHYWLFISPASNVEYDVTVRDVRSGVTRTFSNPLHDFARLFADTSTFPCGP